MRQLACKQAQGKERQACLQARRAGRWRIQRWEGVQSTSPQPGGIPSSRGSLG